MICTSKYEEFRSRTIWSLSNAFTSAFKELDHIPQFKANACVGAATYNAVHTYVGPLALAVYSVWAGRNSALLGSLIWMAHIGLDRMLGFGLKYPTRFKDTHLNPDRHALWIADSAFGSLRQAERPR
jgi:hypothetical protein